MLLIWQCSAAQSKFLRCVSGITSLQLFIWSNCWNNEKIILQLSCNMLFYMKVKQSPSCLRSQPGPGSVWCKEIYRHTAMGHCSHTHNFSLHGSSHCSKAACLNVELNIGFMVNLLCPLLLNQQDYYKGMSTKKLPVVISKKSSSLFIQCVKPAISLCSERASSGTGTSHSYQPAFPVSSVWSLCS